MKIMKVCFVIVSFSLLSFAANAQASVGIGIKGGLNFANVNATQSAGTTYNNRTGYHFGAFTLIKLGKIGIQPEVLFSKQGTKYSYSTTNVDANFDYVNIPVILKLYTVAGINLQVGPQIGFLSGGDIKSTTSGATTTQGAANFVKSSDLSIALGAGWDLPMGLSIDARYNLGVSDNNNVTGSSGNVKNQVIMVSVGYRLFKFGK
ncbi:MAG: PorT family protein [Bacteroidetes bacterium]|nr:PorT family protein [Bacteroidota bacterium]